MCLIIAKPKGFDVPEALILQSVDDNPDGWGMSYSEDGKLYTEKGMDKNAYIEAVKTFPKDQAGVFHTRIATKGGKEVFNCHPFRISKELCVFHNGTIPMTRIYETMSDTWHFAFEVIRPALARNPELLGNDKFKNVVENVIGINNKIVIMNNQGEIFIFNRKEGTEWKDLWLSNNRSTWGKHFGETHKTPHEYNQYFDHNHVYRGNGIEVI